MYTNNNQANEQCRTQYVFGMSNVGAGVPNMDQHMSGMSPDMSGMSPNMSGMSPNMSGMYQGMHSNGQRMPGMGRSMQGYGQGQYGNNVAGMQADMSGMPGASYGRHGGSLTDPDGLQGQSYTSEYPTELTSEAVLAERTAELEYLKELTAKIDKREFTPLTLMHAKDYLSQLESTSSKERAPQSDMEHGGIDQAAIGGRYPPSLMSVGTHGPSHGGTAYYPGDTRLDDRYNQDYPSGSGSGYSPDCDDNTRYSKRKLAADYGTIDAKRSRGFQPENKDIYGNPLDCLLAMQPRNITTILMGNLLSDTTEDELKKLLEWRFGVMNITIAHDPDSITKTYAYVDMINRKSAEDLMHAFKGVIYKEGALVVRLARLQDFEYMKMNPPSLPSLVNATQPYTHSIPGDEKKSVQVYIGNIPISAYPAELLSYLKRLPHNGCRIKTRSHDKSIHYAFVEFENDAVALQCLDDLSRIQFHKTYLVFEILSSRDKRLQEKFDRVKDDKPQFALSSHKHVVTVESLVEEAKQYQEIPARVLSAVSGRVPVGLKPVSTFYKLIANYKTHPLIGLKYITEYVASHKPSSRFICSLCVSAMDKSTIVNHLIGKPHRLKCIEEVNPTLYQAIMSISVKLDQVSEVFKATQDIETKQGRGNIEVLYPANADKIGGSTDAANGERGKSIFATLAVKHSDYKLIGLKYVTEFVSREDSYFTCDLCSGNRRIPQTEIMNHLICRLHRRGYLEKEKPTMFLEVNRIHGGHVEVVKALSKLATDIEGTEGRGDIKVVYKDEQGRGSRSGESQGRSAGQKRSLHKGDIPGDDTPTKVPRTNERSRMRDEDVRDRFGTSRMDRSRDRGRSRDRERSYDRKRSHDRDRSRDRERSRNRERSDDRKRSHDRDRSRDSKRGDHERRGDSERRRDDDRRAKRDDNRSKADDTKSQVDNKVTVTEKQSTEDDGKLGEADENIPADEEENIDDGQGIEAVEETEGAGTEENTPAEADTEMTALTCKLQAVIKNSEAPMLGLSFITEFQNASQPDNPKYTCSLCECNCGVNFIVPHITGIQHRTKVMEKFYPEEYAMVAHIKERNEKRIQTEIQAKLIEVDMGREEISVKVMAADSATAESIKTMAVVPAVTKSVERSTVSAKKVGVTSDSGTVKPAPVPSTAKRPTVKPKTDVQDPKKTAKFVIPKIKPAFDEPSPIVEEEEPIKISLKPGRRLDVDDLDILQRFEEQIFCEPPILKYDNPFRGNSRFLCGQCGYRDQTYNIVMTHRRQTGHKFADIFENNDLMQLGTLMPEFEVFTCSMCGFNGTTLDSIVQHISVNPNHKKNVAVLVGGIYFSPNYMEAVVALYHEKMEKDKKTAAESIERKDRMAARAENQSRREERRETVLGRSDQMRYKDRASRLETRDSKMERRKSDGKRESDKSTCEKIDRQKSHERPSRSESKDAKKETPKSQDRRPQSESKGAKAETQRIQDRWSQLESKGAKAETQRIQDRSPMSKYKGGKTETSKDTQSRPGAIGTKIATTKSPIKPARLETGGAAKTESKSVGKTVNAETKESRSPKVVDKTKSTETKHMRTETHKSVSKTVSGETKVASRMETTGAKSETKLAGKSGTSEAARAKAESPWKVSKAERQSTRTETPKSFGKPMNAKTDSLKMESPKSLGKTGAKTASETKSEMMNSQTEKSKFDGKVMQSFVILQRLKSPDVTVKEVAKEPTKPAKGEALIDLMDDVVDLTDDVPKAMEVTAEPDRKTVTERSGETKGKSGVGEREIGSIEGQGTDDSASNVKEGKVKEVPVEQDRKTVTECSGETKGKSGVDEREIGSLEGQGTDDSASNVKEGKVKEVTAEQDRNTKEENSLDEREIGSIDDLGDDECASNVNEGTIKRFICAFCGFNSFNADSLERHNTEKGHQNAALLDIEQVGLGMDKIRLEDQQRYSCSVCAFSSDFKHLVKCHTDKHSIKATVVENAEAMGKREKGNDEGQGMKEKGLFIINTEDHNTQGQGYWECTSCAHICPNTAIARLRHFALRHTPEAPYTCSVCWLRSTEEADVISHQKATGEMDGNIIHKIGISPVMFGPQRDYIEVPDVSYMACCCGYTTVVKSLMREHVGAADDKHREVTFKGGDVDKAVCDLNKERQLPAHALTEVKQYRPLIWKCRKCDASKRIQLTYCVDSAPLQFWPIKHHLLNHTPDAPYFCGLCGFKALSRERVREHIVKRKHGSDYEILQGDVITFPSFDAKSPDVTLEFCSDPEQGQTKVVSRAIEVDSDEENDFAVEKISDVGGKHTETYKTMGSIVRLMKSSEPLHGYLWKCTSCGMCTSTERLAVIHYQHYHSAAPQYRCGDCGFPGWNLRYIEQHFHASGHSCENLKENSPICYPYFYGEQQDFVPVKEAEADKVGRGKQDTRCIPGDGYKSYRPMVWECQICKARKPWPAHMKLSPDELLDILRYPFTHHNTHTRGITTCAICGMHGIHCEQMKKHEEREKHRLTSVRPIFDGSNPHTVFKICELEDETETADKVTSVDGAMIKTRLIRLLRRQVYKVTPGKALYFVKDTPPQDYAWKCTTCGVVLTTPETASHFLGYHSRCPDDDPCTVCHVEYNTAAGIDRTTDQFYEHIKKRASIVLPYFFGPQADFVPIVKDGSVTTGIKRIPCKPLQLVKQYETMVWSCKLCGRAEFIADNPEMKQTDLTGNLKEWPIEHFVLNHSLEAPFMCPCGQRTMDKVSMESHCRAFEHDILAVKVGNPTIPNLIGRHPDLILTLVKPVRTTDVQDKDYLLEKELSLRNVRNVQTRRTARQPGRTAKGNLTKRQKKKMARKIPFMSNNPEDQIVVGEPIKFGFPSKILSAPGAEIVQYMWECTICHQVADYHEAVSHFRYFHSTNPQFSCSACGFRGLDGSRGKKSEVEQHMMDSCNSSDAVLVNRAKEANECLVFGPQADIIPLDMKTNKVKESQIACTPGSIIKEYKPMAWKCNVCNTTIPIDPKIFDLCHKLRQDTMHVVANKHYLLNHSPDVPFICECGTKLHDDDAVKLHQKACAPNYYRITTGKRVTKPTLCGDRPDLVLVNYDDQTQVEKTWPAVKVVMVTGIADFVRDPPIPFLQHFPSPSTSRFWMCTVCGINVSVPKATEHFKEYHTIRATNENDVAAKESSSDTKSVCKETSSDKSVIKESSNDEKSASKESSNDEKSASNDSSSDKKSKYDDDKEMYPFFFGPQADFVPRGRYAVVDKQRRACKPGELIKHYVEMDWLCKRCGETKAVWTNNQVPTSKSILEISRWAREHYVTKHSKVAPYICGQCRSKFYRESDAKDHCTQKKHRESSIIRCRQDSIQYPVFDGNHPDLVLRLRKDQTDKKGSKRESTDKKGRGDGADSATPIVVDVIVEDKTTTASRTQKEASKKAEIVAGKTVIEIYSNRVPSNKTSRNDGKPATTNKIVVDVIVQDNSTTASDNHEGHSEKAKVVDDKQIVNDNQIVDDKQVAEKEEVVEIDSGHSAKEEMTGGDGSDDDFNMDDFTVIDEVEDGGDDGGDMVVDEI